MSRRSHEDEVGDAMSSEEEWRHRGEEWEHSRLLDKLRRQYVNKNLTHGWVAELLQAARAEGPDPKRGTVEQLRTVTDFLDDQWYPFSERDRKETSMVDINAYFSGGTFKGADVRERPLLLTIANVTEKEVGEERDLRLCASFEEDSRDLVVNKTNATAIAEIAGTTQTDGWRGTKIVLYFDPNVTYAGERKGGIRVRAPRQQPQPQPQPQAPTSSGPLQSGQVIPKATQDQDYGEVPF